MPIRRLYTRYRISGLALIDGRVGTDGTPHGSNPSPPHRQVLRHIQWQAVWFEEGGSMISATQLEGREGGSRDKEIKRRVMSMTGRILHLDPGCCGENVKTQERRISLALKEGHEWDADC